MKRTIKSLTKWENYEKKLLQKKDFRKVADKLEYEYSIAQSLIQLRKQNQLTQEELAKKIGTKQPVLSRIETGTVKPSLDVLERIAKALGTRLEIRFS